MSFNIIDDNDLNDSDMLVSEKKTKKKLPKFKDATKKTLKIKNKDKQKLF